MTKESDRYPDFSPWTEEDERALRKDWWRDLASIQPPTIFDTAAPWGGSPEPGSREFWKQRAAVEALRPMVHRQEKAAPRPARPGFRENLGTAARQVRAELPSWEEAKRNAATAGPLMLWNALTAPYRAVKPGPGEDDLALQALKGLSSWGPGLATAVTWPADLIHGGLTSYSPRMAELGKDPVKRWVDQKWAEAFPQVYPESVPPYTLPYPEVRATPESGNLQNAIEYLNPAAFRVGLNPVTTLKEIVGGVRPLAKKVAGLFTKEPAPLRTAQQGPYLRVEAPAAAGREPFPHVGGIMEGQGTAQLGTDPAADAVVAEILRSGTGAPLALARDIAPGYDPLFKAFPPSSLQKQSAIAAAYEKAASGDPAYKSEAFEQWGRQHPEVVGRAQSYDDLVDRAYAQMVKETGQQFGRLPVRMSFHQGEGQYPDSPNMLRDALLNRHLYVFQGGDLSGHPMLARTDPATGLTANEMFRAVHDYLGHGTHGVSFGPKGEEGAWLAHSRMFSPLARLAMTTETRGQNSFVNYGPANVDLVRRMDEVRERMAEARRAGKSVEPFKRELRDLGAQWTYAPQAPLVLPPEMHGEFYRGGMPEWLRPLMEPPAPATETLTHFSHDPALAATDPSRFGTGIKGEERRRVFEFPGAVAGRTSFYRGLGATPESGLGPYRYRAESNRLYDIGTDPQKLGALAMIRNRIPFEARVNPGAVSVEQMMNDLERMAHERGYAGVLSPRGATLFEPVPVTRYDKGGSVVKGLRRALGGLEDILETHQAPMIPPTGEFAPILPRPANIEDYRIATEQFPLPRLTPTGLVPEFNERSQALLGSRKASNVVSSLIERGRAIDPRLEYWYGSEPLRQFALNEGLNESEFKQLVAIMSAASPRNPVAQEGKQGSVFWKWANEGKMTPESQLWTEEKAKQGLLREGDPGVLKLPEGYGSIAQETNFNMAKRLALGETPEDVFGPKVLSYYSNKLGNEVPGTMDVNAVKGPIMEAGLTDWLKTKQVDKDPKTKAIRDTHYPRLEFAEGRLTLPEAQKRTSFWVDAPRGPGEYKAFETIWRRGAQRADASNAGGQALGWFGGGKKYGDEGMTALASKPMLYIEQLEELARAVAQRTGQTPLEVMKRFVQKTGHLAKGGPVHPVTGKPMLQNPGGSMSTERTITIGVDGKYVVIPTIIDGKVLTPDAASLMFKAGKNPPVGEFSTQEEAAAFASSRSDELGRTMGRKRGGSVKSDDNGFDAVIAELEQDAGIDELIKEMA